MIRAEQLPTELVELQVGGCHEVRILAGALSHQNSLRRVRSSDVGTLLVRKHAFLNSSANNPLFQAENCSAVVIESSAWRGTRGPHSIAIDRCGHVVVQPSAFSWLQDFRARHVPRLELQKNAFSQHGAAIGKHGPATTVVIEDAFLPEIPSSAFPSSAAELRFERTEVRAMRRDAICGLTVLDLTFRDVSLGTVERGALSARTLLHRLTMDGVRDASLQSQAVQSAVTTLTIQHSRFLHVAEGAINVTVASVTLIHNSFQQVSTRGFVFKQWDILDIQNNTFTNLYPSGIWSVSERPGGRFTFVDNTVGETNPSGGALHFGLTSNDLEIQVSGNKFHIECHCGQTSWLKRELSPKAGELTEYSDKWINSWVETFHNTSLCVVTNLLARCFSDGNIEIGYMNMSTFWLKACDVQAVINCKSGSDSNEDVVIALPFDPTRSNANTSDQTLLLTIISTGVLIAIITLITYCYCKKWTSRNPNAVQSISYSANKFFRYFCANANNNNNNELPTLPIDGTVITNSIDHLPGIDMAGRRRKRRRKRRPRRRDMGITVSEDFPDMTDVTVGSSSDSEAGTDRTCSTFDSLAPCEDKGTQTVPEPDDLTEELLKELKEKLNDPNYYSEARDMIEHLYDLIKVEERNSSQPSTSKQSQRVPTPDILPTEPPPPEYDDYSSEEDERYAVIQQPSTSAPTALCEYTEPQDHRQHVYTELPSVATRAVGFIKSFLPKSPKRKDEENPNPTAVTEYMEPTDARVHVYTELATSMVNRPLPHKPDSDDSDTDSS
ncbi:hypothetical protein B566_EDAN012398 [Ephemera danica]|nr:hypothetical protein B566_EDAN012398 [Ephemera danica]